MTRHEFTNGLRILQSIDCYELENPEWYMEFFTHPFIFLMRCDDDTEKLILVCNGQTRCNQRPPRNTDATIRRHAMMWDF